LRIDIGPADWDSQDTPSVYTPVLGGLLLAIGYRVQDGPQLKVGKEHGMTHSITVVDHRGQEHVLNAEVGWKVMEIIREADLSIRAECGGCCACATCHVHVDGAWADKISGAEPDEEDLLEGLESRAAISRLSCQIEFTAALDGLKVTLTDDTL
jgi:2Fe-2S ferredoxin